MKNFKMLLLTVIGSILINYMSSEIALADPKALPTNHYMATDVQVGLNNSTSTNATLPNITGPMGVALIFKTFDQITCNPGNYDIVFRIVKTDNNSVVAQTNPIHFTANSNGFVFSQPAVWKVLFPAVGWYRYDVMINNVPIACYYFVVSFLI